MPKLIRKIRRKIEKLRYREQYSLVVTDKRSGDTVHLMPPRDDCIWADPFPLERDGLLYIFIEQQFAGKNGTLGYITLQPDMSCSGFNQVLEKDFHLSYPHLFESGGELYMIPESNENNSIDCYRCTSFPGVWEFHRTLILGICAVDTDIIRHNGVFYLVANVAEKPGDSLNQKAFVYYSDSFPDGGWTAHPANPVVDSAAFSRNAGRVFSKDGKLVRPAQDCARFYGRAMHLMEIEELSPSVYRESKLSDILPPEQYNSPGYTAIGTHTYNESEHYIVTDIKTKKRRFP